MIGAIIVLYNPDFELLFKGLEALLPQVDEVCIIDNSLTNNACKINHLHKVHYMPLCKNIGIAAAQNIGIKYFLSRQFNYVVFSDQDSVISENAIIDLVNAHKLLAEKYKIATIGPIPINRETRKPYLVKENIKRHIIENDESFYEMHSIISSYSLMDISVFNEVGMMNDNLFIDFVDQEWCWRAFSKCSYSTFMYPKISLSHELGKSQSFLGKQISVSTPFRLYYQFRNLLWLCNKEYVPIYWKRMNLKKMLFKCIYYPIFTNSRLLYLKSILKGIKDGLMNNKL